MTEVCKVIDNFALAIMDILFTLRVNIFNSVNFQEFVTDRKESVK